ncbi:MAG TPA: hypothetical protein VLG50_02150 [Candidatus Saccharimonadales bacterium]|nr:hypothetical protein [Candidatus Saccharimonadales bacterium]
MCSVAILILSIMGLVEYYGVFYTSCLRIPVAISVITYGVFVIPLIIPYACAHIIFTILCCNKP